MPPASLNSRRPRRHASRRCSASQFSRTRLTQTRQVLNPDASANAQAVVHYTSYIYNAAGQFTRLIYPSGRTLSISYANGLPSSLGLAQNAVAGAIALMTDLQYAPMGPLKRWNWAMSSGPLAHDRVFDTSGRLVRYPLGEHLRDVSYDAAGRISAYTHYIAATGSIAPAQDQQFSYDSLSRLTQVNSALATWSYTYDANGNRTSAGVNSAAPSVYTLDNASNRLLQVSNPANTLAYDNAGNIVSGGAYTLSYDLRGRMSSIARIGATTTYTYDNHGQRLRKHSGFAASTSVFAYDPQGQLLGEYDSAGNAIREYVWLDGMPVAMFTPDPAAGANTASSPPLVYAIHADHLNTPRVLVDKNNAMRWRWLGEPFGTTAPETSPQGLPSLTFNLRRPGQFYDVESGMFYNLNRDYVPGAGRYTQSDPIGLAGGIDTYGYVGGNPLSYSDPRGLDNPGMGPYGPGSNNYGRDASSHWQRSAALADFIRNFNNMRDANTKKSDQYFHCKANCEATRRGRFGEALACDLSDARELWDQYGYKWDSARDSRADQAANVLGRSGALSSNQSCSAVCNMFRPSGLPANY